MRLANGHLSIQHTSESEVKTQAPFKFVASDVMESIKLVSKGGAKYIVTFIDDYSRIVYVSPIKAKSEEFDRFKEFKAMIDAARHSGPMSTLGQLRIHFAVHAATHSQCASVLRLDH